MLIHYVSGVSADRLVTSEDCRVPLPYYLMPPFFGIDLSLRKAIGLTREKEPEIWDAIRFGALLENVAGRTEQVWNKAYMSYKSTLKIIQCGIPWNRHNVPQLGIVC